MQRGSLMSDFRNAMTRLQEFRRKFEGLLERARNKAVSPPPASAETANGLRELTAFGSNPGNLRMLVYEPERLPRNAPLVVALHGCGQGAAEYDRLSILSSSRSIIPTIVSRGSCRATPRETKVRLSRSGKWSSTPLRP
jgi:hypothetical protein